MRAFGFYKLDAPQGRASPQQRTANRRRFAVGRVMHAFQRLQQPARLRTSPPGPGDVDTGRRILALTKIG